jgi:hypothetical protein
MRISNRKHTAPTTTKPAERRKLSAKIGQLELAINSELVSEKIRAEYVERMGELQKKLIEL